ncbi:hydantoinase/oxoprolinase family protein, partial [bacterium]|nr:hydantoinase/oxoprolinase family protein [bacterium]
SQAKEMFSRFHRSYQENYGYSYQDQQLVEIVNLRVSSIGSLPHLEPQTIPEGGKDASAAQVGQRRVYFENVKDFVECPVYDRSKLLSGNVLAGPAIVEQYDTNTVVYPDQQLSVDSLGNLVISIDKE